MHTKMLNCSEVQKKYRQLHRFSLAFFGRNWCGCFPKSLAETASFSRKIQHIIKKYEKCISKAVNPHKNPNANSKPINV